jgi:hypothetical protein
MKRFLVFALLVTAVLVLCAASVQAQGLVNGPQMYRLRASATVAVDSSLGPIDTLRLASNKATHIFVRGKSGTVDSVTAITGGIANAMYMFQAVADDTTITFIKGGNIYLGAGSRALDALQDMLWLYYDGATWYEICFANNN